MPHFLKLWDQRQLIVACWLHPGTVYFIPAEMLLSDDAVVHEFDHDMKLIEARRWNRSALYPSF